MDVRHLNNVIGLQDKLNVKPESRGSRTKFKMAYTEISSRDIAQKSWYFSHFCMTPF